MKRAQKQAKAWREMPPAVHAAFLDLTVGRSCEPYAIQEYNPHQHDLRVKADTIHLQRSINEHQASLLIPPLTIMAHLYRHDNHTMTPSWHWL